MESSPLAAMHASPLAGWGAHRNNALERGNPFGGSRFNIREQLHRTNADYFNIQPGQSADGGSSPSTTSLAVDLGQNFRIDSETRYVHVGRLWQTLHG